MHCRSLFEQAHDLKVTFHSRWLVCCFFATLPHHSPVPSLFYSHSISPVWNFLSFQVSRFFRHNQHGRKPSSIQPPIPFLIVTSPTSFFFPFSHCSIEKLSQAIDASSNERCLTSADSCPSACGHAPLRSSRWPLSQTRTTTMRITVLGRSHRHIGSGPVPSPR